MLPELRPLKGRKATFLLGTDQYIGEGLDERGKAKEIETRVGITPSQVKEMKDWLIQHGIVLDFYFLKGAGVRANFLDNAYLEIGGTILFEHQLANMQPPDVLHALKEPCAYETFVPGPFLRIGALHSGAFNYDSGVAFLLNKRNFTGIFDGSHVGTENITPIKGTMSVFAGEIAAEFVIEHSWKKKASQNKVVISGGGKAANAFLEKLLNDNDYGLKEVIMVEPNSHTLDILRSKYKGNKKIRLIGGMHLDPEYLRDADAIVLTAFKRDELAPNVLRLSDMDLLSDHSIIIDISIDERGGVYTDDFNRAEHSLQDVIAYNKKSIDRLGKNITYIADDHLPKYKPYEASIAHGKAIMPYIAILLYCSANLGGAQPTARYIFEGNFTDFSDFPQAIELLTHLKNGLKYYNPSTLWIEKKILDMQENLVDYLNNKKIDHTTF